MKNHASIDVVDQNMMSAKISQELAVQVQTRNESYEKLSGGKGVGCCQENTTYGVSGTASMLA